MYVLSLYRSLQTLFTLNDDYEIFQDNELLINYVLT